MKKGVKVILTRNSVSDTTGPTCTITAPVSSLIVAAFTATFTFSEEVSGFVVGDITLINASASNFATSDNITFTATITPTATGTVTIDVSAGVCTDAAGNANIAATQFSVVYMVAKLWLRSNDLTGSDGDAIATLTSREGNTYQFTQTDNAKKITLKTGANGINGLKVGRGDGGDIMRYAGNLSNALEGTVFAVFRLGSALPNTQTLFNSGDEGGSTVYLSFGAYVSGTQKTLYIQQRNADTADLIYGSTTMVSSNPYIATFRSNGSAYSMRLNGENETVSVGGGANNGDWFGDCNTGTRDNFTVFGRKTSSEGGFLNGDETELIYIESYLDDETCQAIEGALAAATLYGIPVPFLEQPAKLTVSEPARYTVFQRSGTTGDIEGIAGVLRGGPFDVEASFNSGAYATIASGVTDSYTGTLENQAQGAGSLVVRIVGDVSSAATVQNVGISDNMVGAGQSNMSGRGTNNQAYSHATLKPGMFGNNYQWSELLDPTDSGAGQVDSVSYDSGPGGSIAPLLATSFMSALSLPMGYVPCAKGGAGIVAWQPGANHEDRNTLYGSMVYRAKQTGCKVVLFWGMEAEAEAGLSQSAINTYIDTFANAVYADLGVKVMFFKLQNCSGASVANVNAAILEAEADNANVIVGPDLNDIATDDEWHIQTSEKLATVNGRVWAALQTAYYGT